VKSVKLKKHFIELAHYRKS